MISSPAAGPAGQPEYRAPITLVHDAIAHEAVILAVVQHGQLEHPRVFDRPAHQLVVLDAMAVIGDRHDPGLHQRADGRKFLARQPLRDGSGREHVDTGFLPGTLVDPGNRRWVIRRRTRVGHADNRREPACRRRPGAGLDGFLGRLARLAQVDVQIDEAGCDHEAAGVDDFDVLPGGNRFGRDEDARAQVNVAHLVHVVGRVE